MQVVADYADQIERIKRKLKKARWADWRRVVFGAGSHKYRVGPPLSERKVQEFEERYSVELPSCYRAFLTGVGNGGRSFRNSAAGPFYGIYPLGDSVAEILDEPELYLSKPATISPQMADEQWEALIARVRSDEDISDEEFDRELGRAYAGLLPIGSQGCTYLHALVLNGPHKGKVVNLDLDYQKPVFTFERNFLDWYERWLDEVISGDLKQDGPTWFGYTMGGSAEHLLSFCTEENGHQTRLDALAGLAKLAKASHESCCALLALCEDADAEIRHRALSMLTKFSYPMAQEPLRTHMHGDDADFLLACQCIHWYAPSKAEEWVHLLRRRLPTVNDPELFRFISYLLIGAGENFGRSLAPFCSHEEQEIRVAALYSLGQLTDKEPFLDCFIAGLDDPSARVVHTALQALGGVRDERLLAAYARVPRRFQTEEHCVLANLAHRLKEFGIKSVEEFRRDTE